MDDPNDPPADANAFWTLRQAPLHAMSSAEWTTYYPAMARWLYHPDQTVRAGAVERLSMALCRAEFMRACRGNNSSGAAAERLAWLLDELQKAHAKHADILPEFLSCLRYHGDAEPLRTPLLAWLWLLADASPASVDPGVIFGTIILVDGLDEHLLQSKITDWVALLDHPSDYVRGCAAKLLGEHSADDTDPTSTALFDLIGAKEIERPGIAGPFWSPQHLSAEGHDPAISHWMLDLLERRKGPVPSNMPFSDIDFYLHELCCTSAEFIRRMLRGGFDELALMTATEIRGLVEGIEPVLHNHNLAAHDDPAIAQAAAWHLATYYVKS